MSQDKPGPRTGSLEADKTHLLTPEVEAAYARDGFVLLKSFLSPEEVEILRAESGRLMENFKYHPKYPGVRKGLNREDAFFKDFVEKGAQRAIVRGLVRDDVETATCAFFEKPIDASGAVEPHRDGGVEMDGATIWIALDDTDVDNGCLHYVPGSHLAVEGDDPAKMREGGVAMPVSAGDAIVHSARCIHYSEQSIMPRRRRAVSCFYWTAATAPLWRAKGAKMVAAKRKLAAVDWSKIDMAKVTAVKKTAWNGASVEELAAGYAAAGVPDATAREWAEATKQAV